eukprot:gnl/Chilomastix_cuspidata/1418.p1 GENE.gnl/Chilomastix_cuspidata/1418~~gnl/Chilomastix_cuspidata/1418.p1  ORF type:complete len:722 (+),score=110.99 gnl/Chilomastix_cuspidata/1418:165-2168(+)
MSLEKQYTVQLPAGVMCLTNYMGQVACGLQNSQIFLIGEDHLPVLFSNAPTERVSSLLGMDGLLLAGAWDGNLYVFADTALVATHDGLCGQSVLAIAQFGETLVAVAGADGSVSLADATRLRAGGAKDVWLRNDRVHTRPIRAMKTVRVDGRLFLATAGNDGFVKLSAQSDLSAHALDTPFISFDFPWASGQILFAFDWLEGSDLIAYAGDDFALTIARVGVCPDGTGCIEVCARIPGMLCIWGVALVATGSGAAVLVGGESKRVTMFSLSEHSSTHPPRDAEWLRGLGQCVIPAARFTGTHQSIIAPGEVPAEEAVLRTAAVPEGRLALSQGGDGDILVWQVTMGAWMNVGRVIRGDGKGDPAEAKQRGPDGKLYDFSFPVAAERGGTARLFVNRGENPYVAANRFFQFNPSITPGIDLDAYRTQVVEFINKNMPNTKVEPQYKVTGTPRAEPRRAALAEFLPRRVGPKLLAKASARVAELCAKYKTPSLSFAIVGRGGTPPREFWAEFLDAFFYWDNEDLFPLLNLAVYVCQRTPPAFSELCAADSEGEEEEEIEFLFKTLECCAFSENVPLAVFSGRMVAHLVHGAPSVYCLEVLSVLQKLLDCTTKVPRAAPATRELGAILYGLRLGMRDELPALRARLDALITALANAQPEFAPLVSPRTPE